MLKRRVAAFLLCAIMMFESPMTILATAEVDANSISSAEVVESTIEETTEQEGITSVEETTEEKTSVGETTEEKTRVEETTKEKTSIEETTEETTSVEETTKERTSAEETTEEKTSVEETTEETTSEKETVEEKANVEEITEETTTTEEETTEEETTEEITQEDTEKIRYIRGRKLTEEELAEQLALIPELKTLPEDEWCEPIQYISMLSTDVLPSTYDGREQGYLTPVKNQNPWDTCAAFQTIGLMETAWKKQYGETLDLSERHLAYFGKNTGYDALDNANDDTITSAENLYLDEGSNFIAYAYRLLNWQGAALEENYPYSNTNTAPAALERECAQDVEVILTNAYSIPATADALKQAIMDFGAIGASYYHVDGTYYYNADTAAYCVKGPTTTNHAIVLVGWDDTYEKENFQSTCQPETDGAWIIKNSWSSAFGDEGYMYISYEDTSLTGGWAVQVSSPEEYEHNYFYGNTNSGSYFSGPTTYYQTYEIKGETQQNIKAVSFLVGTSGVDYSIQLYKDPTMVDGVVTDPASGEALLDTPVTGTITYAGVNMITIPEITVDPEDYVSIELTFSANVSMYLDSDSTSQAEVLGVSDNTSYAGQSFYWGGSYAVDLHTEYGASARINLLTSDANVVTTSITLSKLTETMPTDFTGNIGCNLKWSKCNNASQFEVYRAEAGSDNYTLLATLDADARKYQDTMVYDGKSYQYKVKVYFTDGTYLESNVIEVSGESVIPFEAEAIVNDDGGRLEWDEIADAAGYEIERRIQNSTEYEVVDKINDATITSYEVSIDEEVYEYRVRAYSSSNIYTAWSEVKPVYQYATVEQWSDSYYVAEWIACSGAELYKLYIREAGADDWDDSLGGLWSSNGASLSLDSSVGVRWQMQVEAYTNSTDYSNGSAPIQIYPIHEFVTKPDKLNNMSASSSQGTMTFTWDAADGLEAIYVYRSMDPNDMGDTPYAQLDGTVTSYEDSNYPQYGTYYYWIKAVVISADGELVESDASQISFKITCTPVTLKSVTSDGESALKVTWYTYAGAESYAVYRSDDAGATYTKIATVTDATSYVDQTVTTGKTHYYKVTSTISGRETLLESTVAKTGQTKPDMPTAEASIFDVTVESKADFEYALGTSQTSTSGLTFRSGAGDSLTFDGLKDNTQYYVHVRTKSEVTGETSVYGTVLAIKTQKVTALELLPAEDTLQKGDITTVSATLKSDSDAVVYDGNIAWTATDTAGKRRTVKIAGTVYTVYGTDGKAILSIDDRTITIHGESEEKAIVLSGKVTTVSGAAVTNDFTLSIQITAENAEVNVVAVNGEAVTSLGDVEIGDTISLQATLNPSNADSTELIWTSDHESVATVVVSDDDQSQATVEVKKTGTATIQATLAHNNASSSITIEVNLQPIQMVSATAISENTVKVEWEKVEYAESYQVYRKTGLDGAYELLETITDAETSSYEDATVVTGKTYAYKVTVTNNSQESELDATEARSVQTKPGMIQIATDGIADDKITIQANTNYAYAIGLPNEDSNNLVYQQANASTMTFKNLTPNCEYVLYVRTVETITGETPVYGPSRVERTLVKSELVLSIKDVVLSKGNSLPFSYTVTPENIHYMHGLVWAADDGNGVSYTVETFGDSADIAVKDASDQEILRIANGMLVATGDSTAKNVYLHVSKGSMEAACHVQINVPVEKMTFATNTAETLVKGQVVQMTLTHFPQNADDTEIVWESSNEKVATVEDGEVTAVGAGTCVITAATRDGVSVSHQITVNPSEKICAVWLSEQDDIDVNTVQITQDATTGKYTTDTLEEIPEYTLHEIGATAMVTTYVLKDTGTVSLVKATDEVRLESSNEGVITVAEDGTVQAVNVGTAYVFAYDTKGNGVYGCCRFIVDGEKATTVKPTEYAIDKSIRLSAVQATQQIESYALDAKSSCVVQVKDNQGKVYTSDEDLELFTFTSAKPDVIMVDAKGVVRPNPNYTGKDTSVRVTAALKNDKGNRKVTFTVSLITTVQIDRVEILQVTEDETKVIANWVGVFDQKEKAKVTLEIRAYDSRGREIQAPKLKVSLSDPSVASVKWNAKNASAVITWKKAGRTNLVITGNDKLKKSTTCMLAALSTTPYIDKMQLTMNTKLESKCYNDIWYKLSDSFKITAANTSAINSITIDSMKLGRNDVDAGVYELIQNQDGSYQVALEESYAKTGLKKNTNLELVIKANVFDAVIDSEVREEVLKLKLKVTAIEPKITVKEARTINRFYQDQNETLLILTSSAAVKNVAIVEDTKNLYDDYFEVKDLYRGQWYLKLNNDDGTYNRNNASLKLELTVDGYEPVIKPLTIQTPIKKQSIKQKQVPTIHYGNGQAVSTNIAFYNQTAKEELTDFKIISFESAKLVQGTINGGKLEVTLKNGVTFRNGENLSAKVVIGSDAWNDTVKLSLNVKILTQKPQIVMKGSALTLNNKMLQEKAVTTISTNQQNIRINPSTDWEVKWYNNKTRGYESVDWLQIEYNALSGLVQVGFADGKTAQKGSYKFRIQNVLADFGEVYKDITIKVIDTNPKVTTSVSGKLDLIARKTSMLTGTLRFSNTISTKAIGIEVRTEDHTATNPLFEVTLLSDNKFVMKFTQEGIEDTSIQKKRYVFPLKVTLENGTVLDSSMTVTPVQATPRVKTPAMQTMYKSWSNGTRDYDFVTGLANGVEIERIEVVTVPKGFGVIAKNGHVMVTLSDRGIKVGTYTVKVNVYFKGAQTGTRPVVQTVRVKVME